MFELQGEVLNVCKVAYKVIFYLRPYTLEDPTAKQLCFAQ